MVSHFSQQRQHIRTSTPCSIFDGSNVFIAVAYKIKELSDSDLPVLRDLAIKIYRETFAHLNTPENMEAFLRKDYSVESFLQEFKEVGSSYFFALDGDTPAGYLRLRKSPEAEKYLGPNTVELHRLYVDSNYQGRKVGTFLMQHALSVAREMQVDWIWLGVWEKNDKAQAFYSRWGFDRFSEHVFQMGDDPQTDWLLKRRIRVRT